MFSAVHKKGKSIGGAKIRSCCTYSPAVHIYLYVYGVKDACFDKNMTIVATNTVANNFCGQHPCPHGLLCARGLSRVVLTSVRWLWDNGLFVLRSGGSYNRACQKKLSNVESQEPAEKKPPYSNPPPQKPATTGKGGETIFLAFRLRENANLLSRRTDGGNGGAFTAVCCFRTLDW